MKFFKKCASVNVNTFFRVYKYRHFLFQLNR